MKSWPGENKKLPPCFKSQLNQVARVDTHCIIFREKLRPMMMNVLDANDCFQTSLFYFFDADHQPDASKRLA